MSRGWRLRPSPPRRCGSRRSVAPTGASLGIHLLGAVELIRAGKTDSGVPYEIAFRRGPRGDRIAFDALTPRGVDGLLFMPPADEPAPPAAPAGALSVRIEIETKLSGLLIAHLAEALGSLPSLGAGDNTAAAIGQEPDAVRLN